MQAVGDFLSLSILICASPLYLSESILKLHHPKTWTLLKRTRLGLEAPYQLP